MAPRVGGARRNEDMRAQEKSARRLQAQVAVEGERREGSGGKGGEGRCSCVTTTSDYCVNTAVTPATVHSCM